MPRGGLSSNEEAAQRQREGLARGRETQAKKRLDGKRSARKEAAPPDEPPSTSTPKKRKAKPGSYGSKPGKAKRKGKASGGKKTGGKKTGKTSAAGGAGKRRGGFGAGIRAGVRDALGV